MNFLSGEKESGIPDIAFSGEYTGIFLEVLVQRIMYPVQRIMYPVLD